MANAGLMHLWNQWGIHTMVLVSFTLQVFLLAFGGIRRRSSSAMLRFTLWLAYLLADSTAIYTLGHLSVASRSREHRLVAFWAPFLLLHLGGPDNITAYALEDNRLWLRHLQTLTVQVLAAAYVLYKYMAGSGTLLMLASISMFVAGLVKYCERIWALKRGNMSSIRVSFEGDGPSDFKDYDQDGKLLREGMSKGQVLLRAHSHLDLCKSVFTDSVLTRKHQDTVLHDVLPLAQPETIQYELVEMELSLLYDNLYTKAAVIHTWYGFYVHFIPLLGTATASLLFQLSINGTRGYGYNSVDVIISYVLLVGALALEVISLCRVVLSTWTCWSLNRRRSRGREWLLRVIAPLRRLMGPATGKRLWAGSIGQHNLFHWCTRDRNEIGSRLAKKMGVNDWWNKLHFSGNFSPTSFFSTEDLKEEVLRMLMRLQCDGIYISQRNNFILGFNTRGSFTLERMGMYKGLAKWSVNVDFEVSILVWHIATEAYISWSKAARPGKLVEAIKVLSNYMMFLLLVKPDMLPGRTTYKPYQRTCNTLDLLWSGQPFPDRSWNPFCMFKELFHHDGPDGSRVQQWEKLLEMAVSDATESKNGLTSGPKPGRWQFEDREALANGVFLAKELLNMEFSSLRGGSSGDAAAVICEKEEKEDKGEEEEEKEDEGEEEGEEEEEEREEEEESPPAPSSPLPRSDMFELILGMWVEMMLYAGDRINRDSHARQLTNGGEFITILWLLAHYRNHVVF
ncbi:unnamed protein product [Urochloa humidicola]